MDSASNDSHSYACINFNDNGNGNDSSNNVFKWEKKIELFGDL